MRLTIRLSAMSPAARAALSAAVNKSEYARAAIEEFATRRTEQAALAQILASVQRLEEAVLGQAKHLNRIEEILARLRLAPAPAPAIDSDARKETGEENVVLNQALAMAARWVGREDDAREGNAPY